MMVEATYAFVKLNQIKDAVSAGGMKFICPAIAHPPGQRIGTAAPLNPLH
jgi:hypothetical protein